MKPYRKPPLTPEERAHLGRVKAAGCVTFWLNTMRAQTLTLEHAVAMYGRTVALAEAHHPKDGDRRRGHFQTYGLSAWSHRGIKPLGWESFSIAEVTREFGPSLFHDAREFHRVYGDDDFLIAFEGELLALMGHKNA